MTFDAQKIKKDFPILFRTINNKPLVYLDNAATTQKPKQVIQSLVNYYEKHNANIHRGVHQLSQEATEMYEKAHRIVGNFIGAAHPYEEIIFLKNATEALNLIMHSYAMHHLKKGDKIVSTVMEHHANIVPWQSLTKKGIVVEFVNIKENGTLDLDDFKNKINGAKLVTVTHVSNVTGAINPIKEMSSWVNKQEAVFIVDASQSVPHMPVDVQDLDVDFLCFSGHKLCAPTGTGVLYGKKHLLESMPPFLTGGDMIKEVTLDKSTWNDLPWKFEAGTPDIGGGIALGAAVTYLSSIGMQKIRNHEKELVAYALNECRKIKNIELYGPLNPEDRGGVLTFNIIGVHPHDVASILDSEFGIAIRSGHHCAQPFTEALDQFATNRASFYIYNNKSDIDQLIKGLRKIMEVFHK